MAAFETYRTLIAELAQAESFDAAVLAAMAWQESRFNPLAKSPAGAVGLMQFMPGTWTWAQQQGWIPAGASRENPAQSLLAGIRYMRWLLARYARASEPLALALAGYNSGQGTVDAAMQKAQRSDWASVGPLLPSETQGYVPAVLGRIATYRAIYGAVRTAAPWLALGIGAFIVALILRRRLAA